jgi:glycosyltransferase involved in cell wall biosynthesis
LNILFVHQNFPAQFGHIARHLTHNLNYRCTFVSERPPGVYDGVRCVQYRPNGGASEKTHYFARGFENGVAHAQGVYDACRAHPDLRPDLIVGHSGFGSTLFLRELYDCPLINYFEYYYRSRDSDMDFRPEFPVAELDRLRVHCRNAMILLDLQNCDAGYCPTRWQRDTFPGMYADKVEVLFDGVETDVWRRQEGLPRRFGDVEVPASTRIVTYVSRGFESMRGFDIFMKVAARIARAMPDVIFFVVGADRVAYGGDLKHIEEKSFLQHVLKRGDYDLSRFVFPGLVHPHELSKLLSLSDLHLYFTVPFVLSWSLFNALACGCTVVASDTGPVAEVIRHGENGLLADFYDVAGLADLSLRVLRDPEGHRHLGRAGMGLIREEYALSVTLPRLLDLYRRVGRRPEAPRAGAGEGRRPRPNVIR